MADNYLEKRFDEVFGSGAGAKTVLRRGTPSLDTLLLKNRSYRGYNQEYEVMQRQLEAIASVATKVPTARNQQALRFKLLTKRSGSEKLKGLYKLGRALPELRLPFPGTEPEAFIVICSNALENKNLDIDLGICAQSMLLKAVELGLNGVIICNFNANEVRAALELQYEPLAIIAIGKGAEDIRLVTINAGEDLNYYRKDGVHYVPKIKLEDLII